MTNEELKRLVETSKRCAELFVNDVPEGVRATPQISQFGLEWLQLMGDDVDMSDMEETHRGKGYIHYRKVVDGVKIVHLKKEVADEDLAEVWT